jgi:outer membrane protein assembly factor BamE
MSQAKIKNNIYIISIIAASLLSSCAIYDNTTRKAISKITPYTVDIVQGQAITKEQLASIKIGFTKNEVVLNIGSPSIDDVFNPNVWNYVFYIRNGYKDVVKKRQITLIFVNDLLYEIKSDALPSELDLIKEIDKK